MRGIPTIFGTRDDVFNSLQEDAKETKKRLEELYAGRNIWVAKHKITEGSGLNDATHKTVMQNAVTHIGDPEALELWQYELVEDPNAWIFKLGFTSDEIYALITA